MSEVTVPTVYFDQPGPANTARTLDIGRTRAEQLGLRTILVATTSGDTGLRAAEVFGGYDVVAVTHSFGFKTAKQQEMPDEKRAALEAAGVRVLTCQHAFSSVGRAVNRAFDTMQVDEIMANTLRVVGKGIKVTCEIAIMAADAGLTRTDEPCLAIAGTKQGADTAVVLYPATAQYFFDLRVEEILCKPRWGAL